MKIVINVQTGERSIVEEDDNLMPELPPSSESYAEKLARLEAEIQILKNAL